MLLWGLRPDGATDAPVPRLDGPYAAIDAYVAALPGGGPAGLREQLVHWMRFGFCVLPSSPSWSTSWWPTSTPCSSAGPATTR